MLEPVERLISVASLVAFDKLKRASPLSVFFLWEADQVKRQINHCDSVKYSYRY